MSEFRGILEGEYGNGADLLGGEGEDLLGRISKLPKEQQNKVVRQLSRNRGGGSNSSRQELEQRFAQLPKEIRDGLLAKRLQLADTRFYIVKDIAGKNTIDVFQGTDNKGVGLGNLANQKLEKDNWFIVFAVRMLYAENPVGSGGGNTADFTDIHPIVRNGEYELEAGGKKLIGAQECSCFDTRNRHDIPIGFYRLESTKIIEPQVEIKMPVKFTAAANANALLRVSFIGTSVIPF